VVVPTEQEGFIEHFLPLQTVPLQLAQEQRQLRAHIVVQPLQLALFFSTIKNFVVFS
jgi:hypothetical protein